MAFDAIRAQRAQRVHIESDELGRYHGEVRGLKKKRNPAPLLPRTPALEERVSVEETNLTASERALLRDPNWVTEDDADAIVSLRRLRKEKGIPLEKVLKRYGYRRVEG